LLLEIGVRGYEYIEGLAFGSSEKLAILEGDPTKFIGGGHRMTGQQMMQRCRSALIKQNPHLRREQGAARCVLQYRASLLKGNAREKRHELTNRHIVFQVFEERCNGYTRAAEHPCTADTLRVAFHCRTG